MKEFLKKHYKKLLILPLDALIFPAFVFFNWLSGVLLETERICPWVKLGGRCMTCGGTHFVNDITSLKIAQAFEDNQFLFVIGVFFLVTLVLLNLYCLFDIKIAAFILRRMYSLVTVAIYCLLAIWFILLRNIVPLYFILRAIIILIFRSIYGA